MKWGVLWDRGPLNSWAAYPVYCWQRAVDEIPSEYTRYPGKDDRSFDGSHYRSTTSKISVTSTWALIHSSSQLYVNGFLSQDPA